MKWIMITSDKVKYILDDTEYGKLLKALDRGLKSVFLQSNVIPIVIPPTVTTISRWVEQERQRLFLKGVTICKRCFAIKNLKDRCSCADGMKTKNVFGIDLTSDAINLLKHPHDEKKKI